MASEEEINDDGASLTEAMTGSEEFLVEGGTKQGPSPALVGLLIAAIVGGIGWFGYKNFVASAGAATVTTASGADARKTINEFLATGGKDVVAMEEMLKNTEKVVKQFLAYPTMTQVPLQDLQTNPFRFAAPPEETASKADEQRKVEEAKGKAIKAASELRIESLMTGRNGGTAIINGKVVRPGDTVDDFFIEEIKTSSVIVRSGTFRFELRLAK